ncbi:copper chaperone PCu(A)C [Streptomyces sp. NA04227]|uniref:copper chaperone PCu(A)C n=1 Tax=Streptomyces sp. NA04227 TaxID=2742136 RepID=UPI00159048CF|nr:copper chaperone PCu(A)C [Streptomyces sp. NA04227]QKW07888.1 copper chaperone PCu(A)C [Streptomyces sp. NA04227]
MSPRRTTVTSLALSALVLAPLLAGCSDSGDGDGGSEKSAPRIEIGDAYVPQPLAGDMAAGYLRITNKGGTDDVLTSVGSEFAEEVTLHETKDQAMRQVERFTVPAHGSVVFESGGSHLMFEGLDRKPKAGEQVTLRLKFTKSGTVTVRVPVKPATYRPEKG